jgi:hypothetical protein
MEENEEILLEEADDDNLIEEENEELHSSEEEEDESENEDTEDDDEDDEEPPRRQGRQPAHTRIQQIQREKYQAIDELNRIKEENEYLKRMAVDLNSKAEESGQAAMIHYQNAAQMKIEQAKARKAVAIENGDIQGQLDADVELANASNEIQQINNWNTYQTIEQQKAIQQQQNYEQQLQQQQAQAQYQNYSPSSSAQPAQEWLSRNEWFVPGSNRYNKDMVDEVNNYSEQLENFCYRQGRPDLIMSREYFDEIDRFVADNINRSQRRQIPMKSQRGRVSPVRGRSSSESSGRRTVQLTREEADFAKNMGVDERDYLRYKVKDMQDNPGKRMYGR